MTICDAMARLQEGKSIKKKSWVGDAVMVWDAGFSVPVLLWKSGDTSVYDPQARDLVDDDFYVVGE